MSRTVKRERVEVEATSSQPQRVSRNSGQSGIKIERPGTEGVKSEFQAKNESETKKVVQKRVVKRVKIMATETTCRFCSMTVQKNMFWLHLQNFHNKRPFQHGTPRHVCGFCKFKFYTYFSYEDHFKVAHEPWLWGEFLDPLKRGEAIAQTPECPECPPAVRKNNKFLTWFDVQTHMRTAHGLRPRRGFNDNVTSYEVEEEVEYEEDVEREDPKEGNGAPGLDASSEQNVGAPGLDASSEQNVGAPGLDAASEQVLAVVEDESEDEIELVCIKKKVHSMGRRNARPLNRTQDRQQSDENFAPVPVSDVDRGDSTVSSSTRKRVQEKAMFSPAMVSNKKRRVMNEERPNEEGNGNDLLFAERAQSSFFTR